MNTYDYDLREWFTRKKFSKTITHHIKMHNSNKCNINWYAMKCKNLDCYFFYKVLGNGKLGGRKNKWGNPKGYYGSGLTFRKALSNARKLYQVRIPVNNWSTWIVKNYNLTDPILTHTTLAKIFKNNQVFV